METVGANIYWPVSVNILYIVTQACSQDLERGGSFLVSADRRIGVCVTSIFQLGSGGAASPPAGSGAEPPEANAF